VRFVIQSSDFRETGTDNLKLITPDQKAMKRVFATAFKRSEYDVENMGSRIMTMLVPPDHLSRVKRRGYPNLIVRRDLTCRGLFDEYEQGMSDSD
jgi:hypothetical protein